VILKPELFIWDIFQKHIFILQPRYIESKISECEAWILVFLKTPKMILRINQFEESVGSSICPQNKKRITTGKHML
jgi:hypothetical protein